MFRIRPCFIPAVENVVGSSIRAVDYFLDNLTVTIVVKTKVGGGLKNSKGTH